MLEKGRRVEPMLRKRTTRKTTLTLPEDLIGLLDVCAEATGQNRSDFLSLVLDIFFDDIVSFARGYSLRIRQFAEIEEAQKAKERVKNVAEKLGVPLYERKGKT